MLLNVVSLFQENLCTLSNIDVGARNVVQLGWGGKLFTCDENLFKAHKILHSDSNYLPQTCSNYNSTSLVSMSTVVVELINIISDFWQSYLSCMDIDNFKTILFTLEISHWHAVSFNENLSLRLRLLQISEDKSSLPNLLEQEVLSMEKLLLILFSLYTLDDDCTDQIDYALFQQWIQRSEFIRIA